MSRETNQAEPVWLRKMLNVLVVSDMASRVRIGSEARFRWISSVFIVALIGGMCSSAYAGSLPGAFDFSSKIAVLKTWDGSLDFSWKGEQELIYVDLDNMEYRILLEAKAIDKYSVSPNWTYVAASTREGNINIIRISDGENIKTLPFVGADGLRWSFDDSKVNFGYTESSEGKRLRRFGVYDIAEDEVKTFEVGRFYYHGSEWSASCACFVYETHGRGRFEHVMVRFEEDRITKVEGVPFVGESPNGEYRYQYFPYGETEMPFRIVRRDGEVVYEGEWTAELSSDQLVWKKDRLRFFDAQGLIDLKEGDVIQKSDNMVRYSKLGFPNQYDVAADRDGYILKWDKKQRKLVVEDIASGKDIEKYKVFWERE